MNYLISSYQPYKVILIKISIVHMKKLREVKQSQLMVELGSETVGARETFPSSL